MGEGRIMKHRILLLKTLALLSYGLAVACRLWWLWLLIFCWQWFMGSDHSPSLRRLTSTGLYLRTSDIGYCEGASRTRLSCTYVGLNSTLTLSTLTQYAEHGNCPLFKVMTLPQRTHP
jgi:hypothetical protein